jgi:glucose/arabinose dehydrogenase
VNTSGGERGLLSIAIDPGWPQRSLVYAYYTHDDGRTRDCRLTRYQASGDLDGSGDGLITIDSGTALHLLTDIPDIASNHNGGDLRFGPDGMLYLSIGDDEDRRCEAQNLASLLGKVLRLKVDHLEAGATGTVTRADLAPGDNPYDGQGESAALVWAYGLRNPFRMHVDPQTGGVFVADVGKDNFEEVSHVDTPGPNLGWPHREADAVYNIGTQACPEPPDFTYQSPIDAYSHAGGGPRSVISVGTYRSPSSNQLERWPAEYEGDYFYAEFYQGWVVRLKGAGQSWSVAPAVEGQPQAEYWATNLGSNPVDFQWGPDGALYYLSRGTGSLRRIHFPEGLTAEPASMGSVKSRF